MTVTTTSAKRADPVDLRYLECNVRVKSPLYGATKEPAWSDAPARVATVHADVTLHTFDDDDPDDETESIIARATAYAIDIDSDNRESFGDIIEIFDEMGDEVFAVAEEALSGRTIFDHLEHISEFSPGWVSQLVIIASVEVDEEYRGQRIGLRLLTTLTETVTGPGSQSLIILRPYPLHADSLSPLDIRRASKKIAAAYAGIGYAPFRENVYWRHTARIGPETLLGEG